MTDNKTIDPEQARLAIEWADAEMAFNSAAEKYQALVKDKAP